MANEQTTAAPHTNGVPAAPPIRPSGALVRADPTLELNRYSFEPNTLEGVEWLATKLLNSRLLPDAIKTAEAAMVIIMKGRSLGFGVMQSFDLIYVVNGRPSISAAALQALCEASPDCEYFIILESDAKHCVMETKRRNHPKPTRMSFTFQEAIEAGLTGKDNWKKWPTEMCLARCRARLSRAVYPGVAGNLLSREEAEDEKDMGKAVRLDETPAAPVRLPGQERAQAPVSAAPAAAPTPAPVPQPPKVEQSSAPATAVVTFEPGSEAETISKAVLTAQKYVAIGEAREQIFQAFQALALSTDEVRALFRMLLARGTTAQEVNAAGELVVQLKDPALKFPGEALKLMHEEYSERKRTVQQAAAK
jgi:hypothetical protein